MSRVNRLHELARRLERFRDRVEHVLTLAGLEVEKIGDELSSHVRGVRQHLGRARDEGGPWHECEELEQRWASLQQLQALWEAARDAHDDRARRLWRLVDEKVPLMGRWLRTAEFDPHLEEAPASADPGRRTWGSAPAVPVRPVVPVVLGIQDSAKEGDVLPPVPPASREPVSRPPLPGVRIAAILAPPPRRRLPGLLEELRRGWDLVQARWRQTADCWRTPAAQAFESEHWRPLEAEVQAAVEQMEHLEDAAVRTMRELG